MALVSKAEAARLAGVSRTTIYQYINDGKLSATGSRIDTAELIRVFGQISEQGSSDTTERQSGHDLTPPEKLGYQGKITELEGRVRELKQERDDWRDRHDQAMDMLRSEQENIKLLQHLGSNSGPSNANLGIAVIVVALLLVTVIYVALNSN